MCYSHKKENIILRVHGNTGGLKASFAKELQNLYNRSVPRDRFIHAVLARKITELSREIKRQIGLMIDRNGKISHVIVGDAHQLFIPDLTRHRAGSGRFRGLRLIHTQLRGDLLTQDDFTDLTLLRLDSIVVIQAQMNGLPGKAEFAYLNPKAEPDSRTPWISTQIASVYDWNDNFIAFIRDLEDQFSKKDSTRKVKKGFGAILIGVHTGQAKRARSSMEELSRLTSTAGLFGMDQFLQSRKKPDPKFVIGKGKLQEVLIRAMQLDCEILIFDQELSPSQLRNISVETELKVVDRTQLILDIFAQRAQTREGKLQVEIAQLRYRKPRLKLMPTAMSRLTGGIGGRGPGETKLEINRRRADERLTFSTPRVAAK